MCVCVCVSRNLSSVNQRTREKMRDMRGLVDSLVSYIEEEERADDKVTLLSSVATEQHKQKMPATF